MLKSFQRLGYFPEPELIPTTVIEHIRDCLKMGRKASFLRPEPMRGTKRRFDVQFKALLLIPDVPQIRLTA